MYYMTEAIKQGFFKKQFGASEKDGVEAISFGDIATVSDMWNVSFIQIFWKIFKFNTMKKNVL